MLGSESGHWLAWLICWHSFLSGEKGCTFLKVEIINCWNNTSTSGFFSASSCKVRMYIFLGNVSGFPLSLIFGSPMACTTWKMDDPDGPSCFGTFQTWCLGAVFGSVPCRRGGRKDLVVGSTPGGMCTVELEICTSGHIRRRAMNYLWTGGKSWLLEGFWCL